MERRGEWRAARARVGAAAAGCCKGRRFAGVVVAVGRGVNGLLDLAHLRLDLEFGFSVEYAHFGGLLLAFVVWQGCKELPLCAMRSRAGDRYVVVVRCAGDWRARRGDALRVRDDEINGAKCTQSCAYSWSQGSSKGKQVAKICL